MVETIATASFYVDCADGTRLRGFIEPCSVCPKPCQRWVLIDGAFQCSSAGYESWPEALAGAVDSCSRDTDRVVIRAGLVLRAGGEPR